MEEPQNKEVKEEFDLIYRGTDLEDCLEIDNKIQQKILVIDIKKEYGSTIKYNDCLIEKKLQIILENGPIINLIHKKNIKLFIEFIKIENFLFIDNSIQYIIPMTKSQIARCDYLYNTEKFWIHQYALTHDSSFLYSIRPNISQFFKHDTLSGQLFLKNFGNEFVMYPKYGTKEICEMVSYSNSLNNISYYLNENIEIKEENGIYYIDSEYGLVSSKEYHDAEKKKLEPKYFTIICSQENFLQSPSLSTFCLDRFVNCFSIGHEAKVCPENTFLYYFWCTNSYISQKELHIIGLKKDDIIFNYNWMVSEDFDFFL